MPQKRRTRGNAPTTSEPDDDTKPKKRRVSLACDACRAAREKCDGVKPQCGACSSLNRSCSYTPASKKRGVQSGYLRTVELSLSWLLQNVPDAEASLLQMLQQSPSPSETRALFGKGSSGRFLQETWNQSQVRNAIETLLSSGPATGIESADDEPTAESSRAGYSRYATGVCSTQSASAITPRANQEPPQSSALNRPSTILQLPSQWRSLLNAYESNTHCWLPIMELDALYSQGTSYGSNGVEINLSRDASMMSRHAELWAALAVASYQNGPSADSMESAILSPTQIFHTSLNLIPDEDDIFDMESIRAMLLHSVVFIGRGKTFKASLLLGKIARILDQMRQIPRPGSTHQDRHWQINAVYVARSFLDILCSLSLSSHNINEISKADHTSFQALAEVSTFGQTSRPDATANMRAEIQPMRALLQLHAFATTLFEASTSPSGQTRPIGPEDVVRKLDPDFNFCNSLIPGAASSMTISASLVKLVFLTASMYLAPHLRPSLLPGFSETAESCFTSYGINRTPPLVTLLFQILQKCSSAEGVNDQEDSDLQLTIERLQRVWNESCLENLEGSRAADASVATSRPIPDDFTNKIGHAHPSNNQIFGAAKINNLSPSNDRSATLAGNGYAAEPSFDSQIPTPNPTGRLYGNEVFTGRAGGNVDHNRLFFPDGAQKVQQFDYDALFADLGSIGYVDNAEMNTQLMTNLGFAPDCDLTEMFQSDYGL